MEDKELKLSNQSARLLPADREYVESKSMSNSFNECIKYVIHALQELEAQGEMGLHKVFSKDEWLFLYKAIYGYETFTTSGADVCMRISATKNYERLITVYEIDTTKLFAKIRSLEPIVVFALTERINAAHKNPHINLDAWANY